MSSDSGGSSSSTDLSAFRSVLATRVSDEVVDQLSDNVHTGRYEVGARLPTIVELARAMEVSVPTVSEAVSVLARAGVLRVRRGRHGGITVASSLIPPEILMRPRPVARDLRELAEARRPVELALARLAAERATDYDFQQMRDALDAQERSKGDYSGWTFANFKFHYSIGRAAGSPLLLYFQTEITKELSALNSTWSSRDRGDPGATLGEHEEILLALQSRDLEAVEAAMDKHLLEVEELAKAVPPEG